MIDLKLMNDLDEGADDTPIFREFSDPRLVAVYDTVNPIAEYETFYLDLAAKLSASSIIDIGCGTGLLTCSWARLTPCVVLKGVSFLRNASSRLAFPEPLFEG